MKLIDLFWAEALRIRRIKTLWVAVLHTRVTFLSLLHRELEA